MSSVTTLDLTFAELACLMALGAGEPHRVACSRLGVPATSLDDPVAQAGLASFAVRQLANVDSDSVDLAPELAVIALGLAAANHHLTAATSDGTWTEVRQFFIGDALTLVVEQLPVRCFRFRGVSATDPVGLAEAAISAAPAQTVTVVRIDDGASIAVVPDADQYRVVELDGSQRTIAHGVLTQTLRDALQPDSSPAHDADANDEP